MKLVSEIKKWQEICSLSQPTLYSYVKIFKEVLNFHIGQWFYQKKHFSKKHTQIILMKWPVNAEAYLPFFKFIFVYTQSGNCGRFSPEINDFIRPIPSDINTTYFHIQLALEFTCMQDPATHNWCCNDLLFVTVIQLHFNEVYE